MASAPSSAVGAVCSLTLSLALFASPALAQDCRIFDALDRSTTTQQLPENGNCTRYLTTSGQHAMSCHWSHPYRDPSAQAQANALWDTLTKCRPGTSLPPDTNVNHPDSYGLRKWQHHQRIYAISIKDKSAPNQTLVFMRAEPALSANAN